MPSTFEELADSGSYVEKTDFTEEKKKPSILFIIFLSIIVLSLSAGVVHFLFFRMVEPQITEAAEILLSVDKEVMHTRDDATEFDVSFHSLKKRVVPPEYRDTQLAETVVTLVGVEPEVVDVRKRDGETNQLISNLDLELTETEAPKKAVRGSNMPKEESINLKKPIVVELDGSADEASIAGASFSKDWEGVVLVPDGVAYSRAYTSGVRLMRVEAHPLNDERVRIWARIQNISGELLSTEVGCEFRSEQSEMKRARFVPASIPDGASVDVYFDSPLDRVVSYTVMVKRIS